MNKFECYKSYNSKFGVSFYVRQANGAWYGFNEYGDCVRTTGRCNPTLIDKDVVRWLHQRRGELVDAPVYKEKFTPKLYFNMWDGRVWYVLFTKEDEGYSYRVVGERHHDSPTHYTHSSYFTYCKAIRRLWGDKWIWKEITDNSKESLMKMVIEKGKKLCQNH